MNDCFIMNYVKFIQDLEKYEYSKKSIQMMQDIDI